MNVSAQRANPRSLSLAIVAAVAAAFVAVSPALADKVVRHFGTPGIGTINEKLGDVVCLYDSQALSLLSIQVAGPNVFARDVTAQTDSQRIGWQLIVTRSGGGLVTATERSVIGKATATDKTSAQLSPFTYELHSQPPAGEVFKVKIKLFWYKHNGRTIAGWALHRVDRFTWQTPTFTGEYPAPACASHWG